jgi:outer membrane scaffolding protein for murein synthesis (MipA/OmpV family)
LRWTPSSLLATSVLATSVLATVLASLAVPSHAGDPVTEVELLDVPAGTLAIGGGWRFGQSPYRNIDNIGSIYSNDDYDLLPFFYYQGERLFARGSSAGIHLLNNDLLQLDLLVAYRFDRLEADADDFFRTVRDREQTLEGGLGITLKRDWGELQARFLSDTLDRHNGQAAELTYRYRWQTGRWLVSPFASYVYQDRDLNDYYYGVGESESRPDLPAYQAQADDAWRVGLNTSYRWRDNLYLYANAGLTRLSDTARDSPLTERDTTASTMVGLLYSFGSVHDDGDKQTDPSGTGQWSWRVNYGYTTKETFFKVHTGDLRRHPTVDTQLLGFTLGKLLIDRPRADYWGKVSINRRLENDIQADIWEFNAYAMAMGTGYSPWTSRELFRYGFGFGFSYAEQVPFIEKSRQEVRGRKSNRFLNYLEAQVDTPLRNIFGPRAWNNCYLGVTIIHRSGMFGSSDILGNVDGGSNVMTGHLECKG